MGSRKIDHSGLVGVVRPHRIDNTILTIAKSPDQCNKKTHPERLGGDYEGHGERSRGHEGVRVGIFQGDGDSVGTRFHLAAEAVHGDNAVFAGGQGAAIRVEREPGSAGAGSKCPMKWRAASVAEDDELAAIGDDTVVSKL